MAALADAARRFFPGSRRLTVLGGSSGYSGSSFARVDADGASWCLRRWPAGVGERRLRFIHEAVLRGRAGGFAGLPELARTERGDTVLALGGRLYDAQEWIAGEPLAGRAAWGESVPNAVVSLPPAQLGELARHVALFHASTAGTRSEHPEDRETLSERLAGLAAEPLARGVQAAIDVPAGASGEETATARRWVELLPLALERAAVTLDAHPEAARNASTLGHGDLWAAHVHVAGSAVTGFVDLESLRLGSAAADLAQLALHFGGWGTRDAVLAAYEDALPLGAVDRAALPAAACLDLAGEGAWSLGELYAAERRDQTQIVRRIHAWNLRALLASLEALVGVAGRPRP